MKISLKEDERGLSHVVLILLAVVVLAAVGFAGYRVMNKDKDSTKESASSVVDTNQKELVKECEKHFKDKDLCKFTGNYSLDKVAYVMKSTSTMDGVNSTMEMRSDGKGNTSMKSTNGGETSEIINFEKVTYMKDNSDGQWIKFANNDTAASPTELNPADGVDFTTTTKDETAESTISYKKLGSEKCGNLTCLKYQMIDSTKPNDINYFWFDTKDYRMHRWYSKDDNGTTDFTITYESVKISAPSPVKEFDPMAGIDPALTDPDTGSAE